MADIKPDFNQDWFGAELRKVLHHLYDPAVLQHSPLLALFGLSERGLSQSALRRIVIEAIQALKPDAAVPFYATAWRFYHILLYRYVEQSDQRTVALNLGLSIRQERRQERLAERLLADYLWKRYNLKEKVSQSLQVVIGSGPFAFPEASNCPSGQEEELAWLERSVTSETVDAWEFIGDILRTAAPLLRDKSVDAQWRQKPASSPRLTGRLRALRQALLNLLVISARAVPGGQIRISLEESAAMLRIRLLASGGLDAPKLDPDALRESLEMTHRLLKIAGSELEISLKSGTGEMRQMEVTVVGGTIVGRHKTVLVVDDNADALLLFERYLSGTLYKFVGVRDPEQVLALAEEVSPQVIVLDVMLPGVDGWELLGRLREHPLTCRVPVVVCTILPQEELARALGAAAFIRKPVSREGFLATLDQQLAALGPGC